jgi:hypothetical protein
MVSTIYMHKNKPLKGFTKSINYISPWLKPWAVWFSVSLKNTKNGNELMIFNKFKKIEFHHILIKHLTIVRCILNNGNLIFDLSKIKV